MDKLSPPRADGMKKTPDPVASIELRTDGIRTSVENGHGWFPWQMTFRTTALVTQRGAERLPTAVVACVGGFRRSPLSRRRRCRATLKRGGRSLQQFPAALAGFKARVAGEVVVGGVQFAE